MATAKRVTPPKPADTILLEISPAEARALCAVLNRVSGNSNISARKYTDAINYALHDAGIMTPESHTDRYYVGDVTFYPNSLEWAERQP